MSIQKEWLNFLREQYPASSRIKLRTPGEGSPDTLKPGARGTLEHIGEDGDFHVAWDSGETLPLIIGQDSFTVSPPLLQTLKLYMRTSALVRFSISLPSCKLCRRIDKVAYLRLF